MNIALLAPAFAASAISCVTDLRTGYIYDRVIFPCTLLVAVAAILTGHAIGACWGALAGGGILATLHALTRGLGIGFGDVKLAGVIGAALGAPGAVEMLAFAFISGGAVATLMLILRQRGLRDSLAFAPFLCIGLCGACSLDTWTWMRWSS
jgi:leader peptidase (prepilin peptidase)/N-methyltransferase